MISRTHFAKLLAASLFTVFAASPVVSKAPTPLLVNSAADTADSNLGDGYCGTATTVGPQTVPVADTCTLRAAIQNANQDAALDTILFSNTLTGQQATVTLTSALPAITAPVVIDAATAMTVPANGDNAGGTSGLAAGFTVNGNDQFAVLRFVDGSNEPVPAATAVNNDTPMLAAGNSVLRRLTITNGLTGSVNGGGGIFFGARFPSSLTLNFVNVTSSASTTGNGQGAPVAGPGGGISVADGNALVVNGGTDGGSFRGNITANTALRGGGIAVLSQTRGPTGVVDNALGNTSDDLLTLNNVVLRSNQATVDHGGAIYANLDNGGDIKITGVDIGGTTAAAGQTPADANTAVGDGGGLWVRATLSNSDLLVDNSTIRNNTAVNGAGISVKLGTLQISNTTLSANAASANGGGVWLDAQTDNVSGGSVKVSNSTFSSNSAVANGGGIAAKITNPAASSVIYSTFADNQAAASMGGGISAKPEQFPGNFSQPFTSNIFANGVSALNCRQALDHRDSTNAGYEISSDISCGFTQASDRETTSPQIGALTAKNSPSSRALPLVRPLLAGSPAIDAGNPSYPLTTDQRGADRQDGGADGDPTNGPARRDIGAYEFGGYGLVEFFNASNQSATFEVDENNSPAMVVVRRTGEGTAVLASTITVQNPTTGSATVGSDYTAIGAGNARTVMVTGASPATATFPIDITNDRMVENNESIALTLANTAAPFTDIGSRSIGTVTIRDVENGTFQFAPLTYSVSEGAGMAVLTVTRTNGTAGRVRVTFSTGDSSCTPAATCRATANTDYTAQTAQTIVFENNAASASINIPLTDDAISESAEQFNVTLGSVACIDASDAVITGTACDAQLNATAANNTAAVTITDNDGALALSIGDARTTETEAGQTLSFTVMLNKPSSSTVTVSYSTANGPGGQAAGVATSCPATTSPNSDYVIKGATTLTFVPGDTEETATVTLCGDSAFEGDETFFVNLASATNAAIDKAQGVGTIIENDATPTQGAVGFDGTTAATALEATPTNTSSFVVRRTGNNATSTTVSVGFTVSNPGYSTFTNNGACTTDAAGPDYLIRSPNAATGTTGTVVVINTNGTGTITYNGSSNADATLALEACNDTRRESLHLVKLQLGTPSNQAAAGASTAQLTIQSDEQPRLQIAPTTLRVREGDDAMAQFSVQLLDALDGERICVPYRTNDGSATAGSDYAALQSPADACTGALVWNNGESDTKPLSTMILDDGATPAENDETFTLDLGATAGATIATAQSVVTIANLPRIYFDPVSYTSTGETGTITLRVLRSSGSGASSVEYAITSGAGTPSATLGTDFTTTPASGVGTVSFADGETGPKTIVVTVTTDGEIEGDETFDARLRNPTNATLSASTTTPVFVNGTIQDDDFRFEFASATVTADEDVTSGNGSAKLTVKRVGRALAASSVSYATADGSATAGSDYATTTGMLNFEAGSGGNMDFNVPITADTLDETDETFTVSLSAPTASGTLGTPSSSTITITDNDEAPSLSINDVSVTEGDVGQKTLSFTVTLSAASAKAVMVTATTADGTATAGSDYTANTQMLMFAAGETSKSFDVVVNSDTRNEPDETFTVTLSNPSNATLGDASGTGTLRNDDAIPALAVADATVTEGNSGSSNASFTVTLSAASGQTVTVAFATSNGTATAGSDYTATNGTLSFAAGETSKTIPVAVLGDTVNEPNETFTLTLSAATNATIADNSAVGTISNDDAVPSLTIADTSIAEGSNAASTLMRFTVTLSAASSSTVTVGYATADGTAVAGQDYTATTGTLSIAAGQTSASFTVPVTADNSDENNETFTASLSGASNASIARAQATATINDDDTAPASATATDSQGRTVGFSSSAGGFEGLSGTAQPANAPTTVVYDNGFFTYTIAGLANGGSATVTVTLPSGSSGTGYVNCPSNCISSGSGSGNTVSVTLVDGGPGDADGVANGRISVKAGAAARAPTPTSPGNGGGGGGGGGSLGGSALLVLTALFGLRRRRRA